mmetsp:Transcript_141214/g.343037  ORF Transcript_141214/g.343037 Transcript_141214/m.343037 type:complete len:137 (-) Transcript_141214:258-668(-)
MSKIVNGTIVRPGQSPDLEAGAGGGSGSGGAGSAHVAKAYAAIGERVTVCGREMALWQLLALAAGAALLLGGLKALFYVAIGSIVYTAFKAFGAGQSGSSSSSSGGRPGGGGGGPKGRRGPNIKGMGDLPKPVRSG